MSFTITINAIIRRRLLELHNEAVEYDQGEAFRDAYERLLGKLRSIPRSAGEQIFSLSEGEPVLVLADAPVVLHYAVFERHQVVWIHRADRLASRLE